MEASRGRRTAIPRARHLSPTQVGPVDAVRGQPVGVLFLADCYDNTQAGTERQLRRLIEGLDRARYRPTLALMRRASVAADALFPCPVDVLDVGALRSPRTALSLLRYAWRARRAGNRLVHCFFNDASLVAPLFRCFGLRVIVSRRDMGFWYTPGVVRALRLAVPFVDRYVANSHAVKDRVCRIEGAPPARVSVIYNGRADRFDAGAGEPGAREPIVGIVANLRPIKRIDTLIEALAIVRRTHRDVRALVVGGDWPDETGVGMRARLAALAERLQVGDRVEFGGPADDPQPHVRRFSIAVLCSESEGLSNALIEYMQAARPIVCTRTGGNPELIEDGVTGLLFPVGDAAALAERIDRLLSDPALARRLGQAARTAVRAKCSDARMLSEQMSCYDAVLSGHRASSTRALARGPRRC